MSENKRNGLKNWVKKYKIVPVTVALLLGLSALCNIDSARRNETGIYGSDFSWKDSFGCSYEMEVDNR